MLRDRTRSLPTNTGRGVIAVVLAFVGLSLASTIAKSTGAPGAVVAFWRFLIGASLWHLFVAARGGLDRSAWRAAALPGVAFGVNLSCFFSGVARTPIAHAEFISALAPLVLLPLGAVILKEHVPRAAIRWGVVALGGVALILSQAPAGGTSIAGDLLVVAAMLAWVLYLFTSKSARSRISTPHFMAVMSTVACLTTLPIALSADGPSGLVDLEARAWVLVVVLAVTAGVVAHGLITWSQPHVPVGVLGMLQLAQPALGVLWAALFLGESVTAIQIVGMSLVMTAVAAIAFRGSRRSP